MEQRRRSAEERRLKKMEQVLRSKIGAELGAGARKKGGNLWQKAAQWKVAQWHVAWPGERIWQDEASLSRYRVEMVAVYGESWGWKGRGEGDGGRTTGEGDLEVKQELALLPRERQESARRTAELIYWRLTTQLTEAEKFQAVELILDDGVSELWWTE